MNKAEVLDAVLCVLGIAVLERRAAWEYVMINGVPSFYHAFFPVGEDGVEAPWRHSPMLECFFEEAEALFERGEEGTVSSGVWQEDGKTEGDLALFATAVASGDTRVIVIRLLQDDYTDRLTLLRKAREELLEKRNLSVSLEVFKERSQIDGLTRLYNKNTFLELLDAELIRSESYNHPLSLLILDIDNFKGVNDRYGHLIGDKILEAFSELLTHSLRRNDILGRFGGEEFVALLPAEGKEQMLSIAQKLCKTVAAMRVEGLPAITVSIGGATHRPGESVDTFFDRADAALYEAKGGGKNRACISG